MSKLVICFAESALTDLETIKRWHTERGVAATGDRFVEEIVVCIEALRDYPDRGWIVPEHEQRFLRELIRLSEKPSREALT